MKRNAAAIAKIILGYFDRLPVAEIEEHRVKECAVTSEEVRVFDAVIDELCEAGYIASTLKTYTGAPALRLLPAGARAMCA